MKTKNMITGAMILSLSALCSTAFANTIDADDFVDNASEAGIAEIESAKLALQKSSSTEVKAFAQQIINDHTAANKTLADIAHRKNLKVENDAELTEKAKAYILKHKDGESFDASYAKDQITAHEKAVALFQKGAKSDDADISAFATATLPTLEHHLKLAHELAASTTAIKSEKKAEKKASNQ